MRACKACLQRSRHIRNADTYRFERDECDKRGDLSGRVYYEGLIRASTRIADDLFGDCLCEDMRAEA